MNLDLAKLEVCVNPSLFKDGAVDAEAIEFSFIAFGIRPWALITYDLIVWVVSSLLRILLDSDIDFAFE